MGCTSSAQNMAPSVANSNSDKDENIILEGMDETPIEEKDMIHEKVSESNGIKVLPPCDNLDSHSKLVDTANPDCEKDSPANGHIKESENENTNTNHLTSDTADLEERLSHLEEVVEKVVELYDNGELEIVAEPVQDSYEDTQTDVTQEKNDNNTENQKEEKPDNDAGEAEAEEAASPSQSQCSRATRWEALADIAAELPPSLTVDPITGQIYSLSK